MIPDAVVGEGTDATADKISLFIKTFPEILVAAFVLAICAHLPKQEREQGEAERNGQAHYCTRVLWRRRQTHWVRFYEAGELGPNATQAANQRPAVTVVTPWPQSVQLILP